MQATFQEQHSGINSLVQRWDRRYRWQQTVYWLPRSLLPGLLIGIALLIVGRFVPLPPALQLAVIAAVLVLAGVLVMLGLIWLRPRPTLDSARRFDLEFNLGERISTALELIDGRIHAADDLLMHQVDDAWSRGQAVNARDEMPLQWNRNTWIMVLVALVMLLLLILLPNPQQPVDSQLVAERAAIAEADETVERITEEIAADTSLSDEDREELLQQLARTNEILDTEAVTPEEAFAALSDTETQLEEQADELNQQAQQQQEALQDASAALENEAVNPGGDEGQGEVAPTLQELQENLGDLNEEQADQLASALEQAAQALEQTNPEAAEALRTAAEALRNGDQQAAQEAMQEAAQSLQQQQQQMQQQQQGAEQLQQDAQQLEQAADQVAQQGQQQEGQQQSDQTQQQPENSNDGVQQLQQSEQQGQQQGQQPGQQQAQEQGQPGEQQGEGQQQGGQQPGQPGQTQQQGQQTNQAGQAESQQGATAGGAGDAPGDAGSEEGGGNGQPAAQDNDPDGQGEGEFAPVYSPRRIGGEGESNPLFLESDPSDVPLTEGEFAENPTGEALVPYNQVYSDYSDAANRALESDYIPLGLRDVVHDYFTSLEPGQ